MRLQFVLSEIGIGLRRNFAMTVSVILVTFVSLAFVGAAVLLQTQIGKMKTDWYDQIELSIFLCPAANSLAPSCAGGEPTQDQIDAFAAELDSEQLASYVQQWWFESKEEAYANLLELPNAQSLAQSVTAEEMQASFRVQLVDPERYEVVVELFEGRDGVEEVQDQREIFEPLFLAMNRLTLLAGGLAAVMLVAAVLLITTTIRLSAMSRRRETGIMRLVGASNLFIQLPFMLEGAIAATIGATMAVGGLWLGVRYLIQDWLASTVDWVNYVTTSDVLAMAPLLFAVAVALALISSLVTLSKYARV